MSDSANDPSTELNSEIHEVHRFCRSCGSERRENDEFCRACGEHLAGSDQSLHELDPPQQAVGSIALTEESRPDISTQRQRPRWHYAVGIALFAVLAVAGDVGLRHWSWNELLARTAHIDNAELWQPYMETTFCEFSEAAVSESTEDLYWWTVDAYREVATLSARLEQRINRLDGLSVAPWHSDLQTAKSRILDHYDVWLDLLRTEVQYLSSARPEEDIYNRYLDAVLPYEGEIAATFEAARDAYYMAEPGWIDNPQAIEAAFLDSGEVTLSCDANGVSA